VRTRVFLREDNEYRLAAEISVDDADHAWRRIEAEPDLAGRRLAPGDVVYISDEYLELNGDGGWRRLGPSELTQALYRQILSAPEAT
jgi:hypothetical protein